MLLVKPVPVTENVCAAEAVPIHVVRALIVPDFVILGPLTVNATVVAQPDAAV